MRTRTRRSELTCGYSLPGWLADDGLKSFTAGAWEAGAAFAGAWGGCARAVAAIVTTASTNVVTRAFIIASCLMLDDLVVVEVAHERCRGADAGTRVIECSPGRLRRREGSCGATAATTVNAFTPCCQLPVRTSCERNSLDDTGDLKRLQSVVDCGGFFARAHGLRDGGWRDLDVPGRQSRRSAGGARVMRRITHDVAGRRHGVGLRGLRRRPGRHVAVAGGRSPPRSG